MKENQNIPKLRFPEFENEWKPFEFGKLYEFISTNSLSREVLNYDSGEVKNIHYGDIHTKFKTHFYIEKELVPFINSEVDLTKISEYNYCREGDLVIADASEDYNDIGKSIEIINLNDEVVLAGLHTFLARPVSSNTLIGFTSNLLKSWKSRKQIMTIAQGTKVLGLSTSRFSKVIVDFPTLPEQQKIASFLSEVDAKIQQLKKKKELLEQYKKGMMQKLFSQELRFKDENGNEFPKWEKKRLGEVKKDARLGGNYDNYETISDAPLIKMGNLGRGSINLDKVQYLKKGDDFDKADILKKGDLLFNTRNTLELVGKVAIWKEELPFALYNSNLMKIEFDESIESSNHFMNYLLNTHSSYAQLKSFATGTTSVAAIYGRDLWQFKLLLPCKEEQTKIASFLQSLDEKISQVDTQLTKAETWKKGLLQQMFV